MTFEFMLSACVYGDFKSMQETYRHSNPRINIREQNDILFKSACRFNQVFAAKWLTSICPDYEIVEITSKSIIYGIKAKKPVINAGIHIADCPICMEESRECMKTPCSHIFCHSCISRWCEEHGKPECPLCRQDISAAPAKHIG